MFAGTPALAAPDPDAPPRPGDLEILGKLGRGSQAVTYQGRIGGRLVAIKTPHAPVSEDAADTTLQFRREAGMLARLRHPGLPAILELGESDGRPYIVMEYVRGHTLAHALAGGPLPQSSIVALASTLAGALAELHRHGLVHRDVKPANVIFADGGEVKLIDFGLVASRAGEAAESEVAGTLLYCPPEQTGMLARPVDGRSDLYALGALLFECATGRPPFTALNAADLLRQHAATPVPDPRQLNPSLSPSLAALIRKLLAKDPDDRYQRAESVVADLERLPDLDAALADGRELLLGREDASSPTPAETDLVGRAVEMARLRAQWQRAVGGRGSLVLVQGEVGSGKSRLVGQLAAIAEVAGKPVISAACLESDLAPLAPLRAAVEGWIRRFERLPREQRQSARGLVRAAAGESAPLLKRLGPGLAALLRDVPDPPDLAEGREQFYEAVADFLLRLARSHGGAVLLLEEVRWLDQTSGEVLARLAARLADAPLLVVCTARTRDDEHAPAEHLLAQLEPDLVTRIPLPPLDAAAIHRLVADYLGSRQAPVDLAHQIAVRGNGNPLAALEYLRTMLEAGFLRPAWDTWQVDLEGLDRLDLPHDVLELVTKRLLALGQETHHVLCAAAVLGSTFRLDALAAMAGLPTDDEDASGPGFGDVAGVLSEALRANVVVRAPAAGEYAFVHDRVREVLLSALAPAARRRLHQRAANALQRAASTAPDDPDLVFAVARHYALGETDKHPRCVYETSLRAGLEAIERYADEEAFAFLDRASRFAAKSGAEPDPRLEEALSAVCARTGRWARATAHLDRALERATDPVVRANLCTRLAQAYLANRETSEAWERVQQAFRELGAPFPRAAAGDWLRTTWDWLLGLLAVPLLSGWLRPATGQRELQRSRALAAASVMASQVAYVENRPATLVQLQLRSLRLAPRLGSCRELPALYVNYGLLMATLRRRKTADRYMRRALQLAEELGDRHLLARCLAAFAWTLHVSGAPVEAERRMRQCMDQYGRWLDAEDYVTAATDLGWSLLMRGYCREGWEWVQRAMRKTEHAASQRLSLATDAAALLAVLGHRGDARAYLDQAQQLVYQTSSGRWRRSDFFGRALLCCLEQDELGAPLEEAVAQYKALGLRPERASFHSRHFYVFQAYARLAQCMRSEDAVLPPTRLRLLREALQDLRRAAADGHPTLHSHRLVVEAAWQRLRGEPAAALRTLARAEASANAADNPWAWFEAARQRAHVLRDLGHQAAAARQAQVALALAVQHGWVNRARWIRTEFELAGARGGVEPLAEAGHSPGPSDGLERLRLRRHLDALLQVSLAAATLQDPEQQARAALDEIIRILAAERGFLFLAAERGEELLLRAGRDAHGQDLSELTGYSRTVVEAVRTGRQPVVVSGTQDGVVLGSESIVAHDLRSIVAAPLLMRERLVGVVYLDNRLAKGLFTQEDLGILLAIASHIAIAVDTAEAFARQAALSAENARLLDVLRAQIDEIERARRLISAAEERLRREIAELLHSRVQTKLLVAWHRLGQVEDLAERDPSRVRPLLAEVRAQIDQIREHDVRRASHLLHPSIIGVGLVPAVRSLAQAVGDQFQVTVEADPYLTELDSPVDNQLSGSLRLTAYRAVEEALANVARHAQATRVEIFLRLSGARELEVVVQDNGRGFDPETLKPGLGLNSIAARVGQAHGTWHLAGGVDRGARLVIRFPITQPPAEDTLTEGGAPGPGGRLFYGGVSTPVKRLSSR